MNNSELPNSKGSQKVSDDSKSNDGRKREDQSIKTFTGYVLNVMERMKKTNLVEHVRQIFTTDHATVSKLVEELSSVEVKIEELFDKVMRQVLNFVSKDIGNLKTLTKEDKENLEKILIEYKTTMEKNLEVHTKNVDTVRMKLHTGIISQGEIEQFISVFDEQMLEIRKITDKMLENLEQKELDNFKMNLRRLIDQCSDEIENTNDSFIESLERMAESSTKAGPVKKPSFAQIKLPNTLKTFAQSLGSNNAHSLNGKPSPFPSMKKKLPSFDIKEFFNSETYRGRANAAKTTYLVLLIGFVYWKWRSSRS